MTSKKLILASRSPRRTQLLTRVGVPHIVQPADVEEWEDGHEDPSAMVLHNAQLKADALHKEHPSTFILGADTTVALDGQVLSKPADMDEARSMLMKLSGRAHEVFTGVVIYSETGDCKSQVERSVVHFKELSDAIIDEYFGKVDPLDKAGAYGIQEGHQLIIERWEGSLSNIVGLPLAWVEETLRSMDFFDAFT